MRSKYPNLVVDMSIFGAVMLVNRAEYAFWPVHHLAGSTPKNMQFRAFYIFPDCNYVQHACI